MASTAPLSPAADLPEFNAAYKTYRDSMKTAQATYRRGLAEALSHATKIEIFLLDFDTKEYPDAISFNWDSYMKEDFFPIIPYHRASRILARKTLTAAQIKTLLPVLQNTVSVQKDEGGMACHFPIHGIRVWVDDFLLFQTSFCWYCGNFYVKYPDETAGWLNIEETDLRKIFNHLMPIPAAEQERFDKTKHLPVKLRGE